MSTRSKLEELLRLRKEKSDATEKAKKLTKSLTYNLTLDWLDMLGEEEILLLLKEFSIDSEVEKEFKIIKGYYLNRYE